MSNTKSWIYTLLAFMLVGSVAAANILDNVFRPFSGIDFGSFYLQYYSFLDAVVYLILFMGLAQFVFMKVYKNDAHKENPFKEAKLVSIAVGLALTVGMSVMENRTGFNLASLYPVAIIIILILLAVLLYNLLLGLFPLPDNKKFSMVSASLTYLIIYGLLVVPFSALNNWLETNAPLLSAVFAIASIVAFIYLLIQLFGMFGGDDKKELIPGPKGDVGPAGPPGKDAVLPPAEDKPKDTAAPNQFVDWLDKELPILQQAAKAYSEKAREVVELHKNNKDTAQDWAEFKKRKESVITIIGSFNTMLTQPITNQGTLSENDLGRLLRVFQETGSISAKMLQFNNQLVDAYNNKKDAPADPF